MTSQFKLTEKTTVNLDNGEVAIAQIQSSKLTHKQLSVLKLLVANKNTVVTRDTLVEQIWDDNYRVGQKALTQAIWSLRKELQLDESNVIETIPRTGYILHSKLEQPVQSEADNQPSDTKPAKFWWAVGTMLTISLVLLVTLLAFKPQTTQTPHSGDLFAAPPKLKYLTSSTNNRWAVRASRTSDEILYFDVDFAKRNSALKIMDLATQVEQTIEPPGFDYLWRTAFSPLDSNFLVFKGQVDKLCQIAIYDRRQQLVTQRFTCDLSLGMGIDWSVSNQLLSTRRQPNTRHLTIDLFDLNNGKINTLALDDKKSYAYPRFSADGNKIAFATPNLQGNVWKVGIVSLEDNQEQLFDLHFSVINQVEWDEQDNLWLLAGHGAKSGVWKLDTTTGLLKLAHRTRALGMSFSLRDQSIVVNERQYKADIYHKKSADNTESALIMSSQFDYFNPKLSPNESQLGYLSTQNENIGLWVYDFVGQQSRKIPIAEQLTMIDYLWADEQRLYFVAQSDQSERTNEQTDQPRQRYGIYTIGFDGNETLVLSLDEPVNDLTWTDGQLSWQQNTSHGAFLISYDITTKKQTRLPTQDNYRTKRTDLGLLHVGYDESNQQHVFLNNNETVLHSQHITPYLSYYWLWKNNRLYYLDDLRARTFTTIVALKMLDPKTNSVEVLGDLSTRLRITMSGFDVAKNNDVFYTKLELSGVHLVQISANE